MSVTQDILDDAHAALDLAQSNLDAARAQLCLAEDKFNNEARIGPNNLIVDPNALKAYFLAAKDAVRQCEFVYAELLKKSGRLWDQYSRETLAKMLDGNKQRLELNPETHQLEEKKDASP